MTLQNDLSTPVRPSTATAHGRIPHVVDPVEPGNTTLDAVADQGQ